MTKSAAETRSEERGGPIPAAINLSLATLHALVNVYQFFVSPWWLLPANMAWFALALFCYGSYWPILIIVVGSRAFLISFLDNVYHCCTPVNDIFYAHNL